MVHDLSDGIVDSLTLRFTGEEEDGSPLHELRAAHVAEVLQGVVGLAHDFDKAGVFNPDGPVSSEVLVRPAQEGSFLIEVVRVVTENWETIAAVGAAAGVPSLAQVVWWATKSARAEVKEFDYLDNGNVKVVWQDDSAQEVSVEAWSELQKRTRRRKKQLRQIMTPLADLRVTELDVAGSPRAEVAKREAPEKDEAPQVFVLGKPDYDAVKLSDEVEENQEIFETEAQMSAIDFDDSTRWRVKTKSKTRNATVEDMDFLRRVAGGLAIRKGDIFRLRVREDSITKNGRTRTSWTVLKIESHRRASGDDDVKAQVTSSA